jgi:hypothetical protein
MNFSSCTKKLFILIVLLGWGVVKADSTDYWRVYYNNIQVLEHHPMGDNDNDQLVLSGIGADDMVKISYYHLTPLEGDRTLSVQDENGKTIYTLEYKKTDTDQPMYFRIVELYKRDFKFNTYYNVFLSEKVNGKPDLDVLLFRFKIKVQ